MHCAKFASVLLLFCFLSGSYGRSVSNKPNEVYVYKYKGHIDTRTSASNNTLARWTISGDFHISRYDETYGVMKLVNVKSSLFNGPESNLKDIEEKEIPNDAKVIEQMFAVNFDLKNGDIKFLFQKHDPLWSRNMKKGIFNFMQFKYQIKWENDTLIPSGNIGYSMEDSIYGKCLEHYSYKTSAVDEIVYERRMDGLNCSKFPLEHNANTGRSPGIKDLFDVLDFKSTKVCTLRKRNGEYITHDKVLKTRMEYKTSPSSIHTYFIDQEQSMTFSNSYIRKEAINILEYSIKKDKTYEMPDNRRAGRHFSYRKRSEFAKDFLENYNKFFEQFSLTTPKHFDVSEEDYIYQMYEAVRVLDTKGHKEVTEQIFSNRTDFETILNVYFSLLIPSGDDYPVNYLIDYMQKEELDNHVILAHKIFSTFPKYIRNPDDDTLVKMEPFLNLVNVQSKSLKTAGILSFASAVNTACQKNTISKKYKSKYIDMFQNKYLEGNTYDDKMTYLLGLINMAKCLDYDLINSITCNTSESSYIRALAFTGFKENLKVYTQVYETYWPIVQKKSEPFEVRVRALDVLLASKLTKEQFNSIVRKYSESENDPEEQQLANYVLSTLHSIKSTTGFYDNLGDFASEALKNNKIPIHPKKLATGHYRLSYTDSASNYGSAFDIRLITDPQTNILNTIQVSFNSFGNSFDFGTYTLYIKFNGLIDTEFIEGLFNKLYDVPSVPEVLRLLKENNFDIQKYTRNFILDIVLLIDNVAVYSRHFDDPDEVIILIAGVQQSLGNINNIWYPVLDYVNFPSDFGTPIEILNCMQEVTKQEYSGTTSKTADLHFRSSWLFETTLEMYNPLLNAYAGSYKYNVDQISLNLYDFKIDKILPPTWSWTNKNSSFAEVWDNVIGTMASEKVLKEYCPKCDAYNEVDVNYVSDKNEKYEVFGFEVDYISSDKSIDYEVPEEGLPQFNIDGSPYAGPFLYMLSVYDYNTWLRSEVSKGSAISIPINGLQKTKTTISIQSTNEFGKYFESPSNVDLHVNTSVVNPEDNNLLTSANFTGSITWNPNLQDSENETIKNKIVRSVKFDLLFNSTYSDDTFKIFGNGELIYPDRKSDRLPLLPFETITGETKVILAKYVEENTEFVPYYTFTFKDVLSSINKEDFLENQNLKDSYDKCSEDSKGLKFTAPTEECKMISSRLTEYNKYQIDMKIEEHNNGAISNEESWFEIKRVDEDYVTVKVPHFASPVFKPMLNRAFNIYYPELIENPSSIAYNVEDSKVLLGARSVCLLTPSKVQQFSGKYIENQRNEWLAFASCYNVSYMALNGRTIDDKHVGFTFYYLDQVIEATVKDNKAYITLNGQHLTEYHSSENVYLMIYFLDENVVFIKNYDVEIYYNTEYIAARANSVYPKILCGICSSFNK